MKKVKVSEEQVLSFRAQRGHLAGPGAATLTEAANAILGAQSQQLPPSLRALSMRTAGRPTAADVKESLFGDARELVRVWGQRDTVHLYDAKAHWRQVIAAEELWSSGGRGGPLPTGMALKKSLARIEKLGGIVTRADLMKTVPAAYVKAVADYASASNLEPKRFAAGRLLWCLAHSGHLCMAEKVGSEASYVLRKTWFAELEWPSMDPKVAAVQLMRDYLRVYGPATPHDIAHFFNAKVTEVRRWVESLHHELATIECERRTNLLILGDDISALRRKVPAEKSWPLRLLPMWDSMLMAHADKSWTVPKEAEKKQVWRKAAMVAPVILSRGRIVGTWSQKATKKKLKVQVQPLSLWRKTKHMKATIKEADAVAAHLEIPDCEVELVQSN